MLELHWEKKGERYTSIILCTAALTSSRFLGRRWLDTEGWVNLGPELYSRQRGQQEQRPYGGRKHEVWNRRKLMAWGLAQSSCVQKRKIKPETYQDSRANEQFKGQAEDTGTWWAPPQGCDQQNPNSGNLQFKGPSFLNSNDKNARREGKYGRGTHRLKEN